VGGKVYVMGGVDSGGTKLSSVDCFDPATGTWEVVAPMETARADCCSVSA
jgi:hypothetical protein